MVIDLVVMAVLLAAGYAFFDTVANRFMAFFSVFVVMAIIVADITHKWGIW